MKISWTKSHHEIFIYSIIRILQWSSHDPLGWPVWSPLHYSILSLNVECFPLVPGHSDKSTNDYNTVVKVIQTHLHTLAIWVLETSQTLTPLFVNTAFHLTYPYSAYAMLSQLMWETNLFFWHSSLGHIINGMNVGEDICKHKVYETQQNQPLIYTEFSFPEQNLDLFKQLLLTYTQQYNVS